VISVKSGTLLTDELIVEPNVEKGYVVSDIDRDIIKIAVFDRHKASGYSIGFVHGLSIKNGAVATTIGHDSHNLTVVGTNDEDMNYAISRIKELNGGIVVVKNKKLIASLSLPIAGLMSDKNYGFVVEELRKLKNSLVEIGVNSDILMQIHFLQLAVIPKLKITDKGLIDVEKQKIVDLFVEV
jgi:adenine deaminase